MDHKQKWHDTKKYLNELPEAIEMYINTIMMKSPDKVLVRKVEGKGTFYEYAFFHNGFECFIRLHQGKKNIGEIMGFNNPDSLAFYKRIDNCL